MSCDCKETFNEKLKEYNGKLSLGFSFSRNGDPAQTHLMIGVEKIDRKSRVKPPLAIATFCPFCGTRYEPAQAN